MSIFLAHPVRSTDAARMVEVVDGLVDSSAGQHVVKVEHLSVTADAPLELDLHVAPCRHGLIEAAGGDPYRAAMRAAVRSDSTRCGRLEASIVLKLCARYRLHVPHEMAEAARAKAILSYVKFIDKLQKVHQGEPATPM